VEGDDVDLATEDFEVAGQLHCLDLRATTARADDDEQHASARSVVHGVSG